MHTTISFSETARLIDGPPISTQWTYGSNWSSARCIHRFTSDATAYYDDNASMPTKTEELKFEVFFVCKGGLSFIGFNASVFSGQPIAEIISQVERAVSNGNPLLDTLAMIEEYSPSAVLCKAKTGVAAAWQEYPNVEIDFGQFECDSNLRLWVDEVSRIYAEGTTNPIMLEFISPSRVWIAFSISFRNPDGRYLIDPNTIELIAKRMFRKGGK